MSCGIIINKDMFLIWPIFFAEVHVLCSLSEDVVIVKVSIPSCPCFENDIWGLFAIRRAPKAMICRCKSCSHAWWTIPLFVRSSRFTHFDPPRFMTVMSIIFALIMGPCNDGMSAWWKWLRVQNCKIITYSNTHPGNKLIPLADKFLLSYNNIFPLMTICILSLMSLQPLFRCSQMNIFNYPILFSNFGIVQKLLDILCTHVETLWLKIEIEFLFKFLFLINLWMWPCSKWILRYEPFCDKFLCTLTDCVWFGVRYIVFPASNYSLIYWFCPLSMGLWLFRCIHVQKTLNFLENLLAPSLLQLTRLLVSFLVCIIFIMWFEQILQFFKCLVDSRRFSVFPRCTFATLCWMEANLNYDFFVVELASVSLGNSNSVFDPLDNELSLRSSTLIDVFDMLWDTSIDANVLFSFPDACCFRRAFILVNVVFLVFAVTWLLRLSRCFSACKGIWNERSTSQNMYSSYKIFNGACILPKINFLFVQRPRYLLYLGPCTDQFFILFYFHLQLQLNFEYQINVFVTTIMWCRWIVHVP